MIWNSSLLFLSWLSLSRFFFSQIWFLFLFLSSFLMIESLSLLSRFHSFSSFGSNFCFSLLSCFPLFFSSLNFFHSQPLSFCFSLQLHLASLFLSQFSDFLFSQLESNFCLLFLFDFFHFLLFLLNLLFLVF